MLLQRFAFIYFGASCLLEAGGDLIAEDADG